MTAFELRKLLLHRIAKIKDKSILNALKTVLDSESGVVSLTDQQRDEISESKKNIEKGLFFDQGQLDNEFNKWVNA